MAYADFRIESVEKSLGLSIRLGELFPGLKSFAVHPWLDETLSKGREAAALVSEKARSEFIVVPILLSARDSYPLPLSIFSGQRLDVDLALGLMGECDFIIALTSPIPRLKAPLVMILEAKNGDIDAGLGQCIAQTVAAQRFNQAEGEPDRLVFGCVTSGEAWQFLRLEGKEVVLDRKRLYLDQVGDILATLGAILQGPHRKGVDP